MGFAFLVTGYKICIYRFGIYSSAAFSELQ